MHKSNNSIQKTPLVLLIWSILGTSLFAQRGSCDSLFPFSYKGQWGVMAKNRTVALEPQFEHIGLFYCSYIGPVSSNVCAQFAIAKTGGKFGLLNEQMKWSVSAEYDSLLFVYRERESGPYLLKAKKDGKWGILFWSRGKADFNRNLSLSFDEIVFDPQHAYFRTRIGTYVQVLNSRGLPVSQEDLDSPLEEAPSLPAESANTNWGHIPVQEKGLYGLVNRKGLPLTEIEYEEIESVQYDKRVKKQGLFGLLDRNFNYQLPPIFSRIERVSRDLYWVEHASGYGAYFPCDTNFLPRAIPLVFPARSLPYPLADGDQVEFMVPPESAASFPGGWPALVDFFKNNASVPLDLVRQSTNQGRVGLMQFVVEKDGTLSNLKVFRGGKPELERLFALMPSPWKPAVLNGQIVRQNVTLCVEFK